MDAQQQKVIWIASKASSFSGNSLVTSICLHNLYFRFLPIRNDTFPTTYNIICGWVILKELCLLTISILCSNFPLYMYRYTYRFLHFYFSIVPFQEYFPNLSFSVWVIVPVFSLISCFPVASSYFSFFLSYACLSFVILYLLFSSLLLFIYLCFG